MSRKKKLAIIVVATAGVWALVKLGQIIWKEVSR